MSSGIFNAAHPMNTSAVSMAVTEIIRMASPKLIFLASNLTALFMILRRQGIMYQILGPYPA